MFNSTNLVNLMNDSLMNKVGLFNEGAEKFTDQAIREAFFEILGSEGLTWRTFRRHRIEIFEVLEEVLSTNLPNAWADSPFYQNFVEVRNGALGQRNDFVVEDNSILVASTFSGNHWDTDRQKLQGKRSFHIPTGWIYLHVYDDLERFLTGATTLPEMLAKLQQGLQAEIDSRIFASFNVLGDILPAKFQESGSYLTDTMNSLIEKVQVASQKNVIIAGTRTGLAKIAKGMNTSWISNSAKEELATTGMVVTNLGLPAKAIVIPQTFLRGTYEFKVDNNIIYVLPEGTKVIKLFYEGEVRALDLTPQQTHDMTFSSQVQLKCGVGVVCDDMFGKYKITD